MCPHIQTTVGYIVDVTVTEVWTICHGEESNHENDLLAAVLQSYTGCLSHNTAQPFFSFFSGRFELYGLHNESHFPREKSGVSVLSEVQKLCVHGTGQWRELNQMTCYPTSVILWFCGEAEGEQQKCCLKRVRWGIWGKRWLPVGPQLKKVEGKFKCAPAR